mmetsp:Transcript_20170/g.53804  ORF Transcript_20170/g.53804 Transcript_20170/m.53804 type:complete len:227 (+) Transcript_20170:1165-1845(+)
MGRVRKMPLPCCCEKILGTHQTAVRHVGTSGFVQVKELPDFLKLCHLVFVDPLFYEPVVAPRLRGEKMFNCGRRSEIILQGSLQLRAKVPVLEHLIDYLRGKTLEIRESQAWLSLQIPDLAELRSLCREMSLVVLAHVFCEALKHLIGHMQESVESINAKLFCEGTFASVPNPIVPRAKVHFVPFLVAAQLRLPERQQHLACGVPTEVEFEAPPFMVVASAHKLFQ